MTENVKFEELCIVSNVKTKKAESDEISVVTTKAKGEKCPVCWKINIDGCERHSV